MTDQKSLKSLMLKQVATKIIEATRGTTKRRVLPINVIDFSKERARRRKRKNRFQN